MNFFKNLGSTVKSYIFGVSNPGEFSVVSLFWAQWRKALVCAPANMPTLLLLLDI